MSVSIAEAIELLNKLSDAGDLMTVKEAADKTGFTRQLLNDAIKRGKLGRYMILGQAYITPGMIAHWRNKD